jgi:DNA-binding CsgD family transcriptional regulator
MNIAKSSNSENVELLWLQLNEALRDAYDVGSIFYLSYPVCDAAGTPEMLMSRAVWKTNYPPAYLKALSANLFTHDYAALHLLTTGTITRWHDEDSAPKMTKEQRNRRALDEKYAMSIGCYMPIFTRSHRMCGMFGLSSLSQNAQNFDAVIAEKHDQLQEVLTAFDERFREPLAKIFFKLSPQEMRVLAYLAGGMAVARLAYEMTLSVKTIEAHMASIRKKTAALTSAEAVAKAVFFNLI